MKNILDAIFTLIKRNQFILTDLYSLSKRANSRGDALELYVKNLFADTFNSSEIERMIKWNEIFSWLGNSSNPPDFMLKDGDAVGVKKIESNDSAIALNSSYPKHTLKSSSPLISNACRTAENWTEKDIIYTVGVVSGNELKHLCMVYGRDYCASDEHYKQAQLKSLDPLGITRSKYLSCQIENPWKVFSYVYSRNFQAEFNFMSIISFEKWSQFENRAELLNLQEKFPALKIIDTQIKNPNNPSIWNDAKLVTYSGANISC